MGVRGDEQGGIRARGAAIAAGADPGAAAGPGAVADPGAGAPGAGGESARAAQLPDELKSAVRSDLRMSPQEYLDRARRAQDVAAYAAAQRAHDPAFGTAWLDEGGTAIVAVTTDAAARQVRDAGYMPKIVSAADKDNAAAPESPSPGPLQLKAARTIGGDKYVTNIGAPSTWSGYFACSMGFTAEGADGDPYLLSAGHCDKNGADPGPGVYLLDSFNTATSTHIGDFEESGLGTAADGLDYAVIALDADAPPSLSQPIVRTGPYSGITVTGVARPVVGAPVCKSGIGSGYTCGHITDVDRTEAVTDDKGHVLGTVTGFFDTACTLSGDSGGPILTGTDALGITSASDFSNCRVTAGHTSIGIPVTDITDYVRGNGGPALTVRTGEPGEYDFDNGSGGDGGITIELGGSLNSLGG